MKKTYTLFAKLKYMLGNEAFTDYSMESLKDLIRGYKKVDDQLPANYYFVYEAC